MQVNVLNVVYAIHSEILKPYKSCSLYRKMFGFYLNAWTYSFVTLNSSKEGSTFSLQVIHEAF